MFVHRICAHQLCIFAESYGGFKDLLAEGYKTVARQKGWKKKANTRETLGIKPADSGVSSLCF